MSRLRFFSMVVLLRIHEYVRVKRITEIPVSDVKIILCSYLSIYPQIKETITNIDDIT